MTTTQKSLSAKGEDAVCKFLKRKGCEIVERNWECAAGEIDVIFMDGDTLVFADVRTSSDIKKGFLGTEISKKKRDRWEKIALAYLTDHDYEEGPVRFDNLALVVVGDDRAMIRHHINAFV